MKRKSLLSMFTTTTLSVFILITFLFGTVTIFILYGNLNQMELMVDNTRQTYEESSIQMLNSYGQLIDDYEVWQYDKLEVVINHTILHIDQDKAFVSIENAIEDDGHDYFILNKDGDILYDESGYFSGSIHDVIDDRGSVAPYYSTSMSVYKFNAYFSDKYLVIIKPVSEDYLIGIVANGCECLSEFTNSTIMHFNNLPDLDNGRLSLIDFEGNNLVNGLTLSKSEVQMMKSKDGQQAFKMNTDKEGIVYYRIHPELKWILINKNNIINESYDANSERIELSRKNYIIAIHCVLLLIIIVLSLFFGLTRRMKKRIQHQMDALHGAVHLNKHLTEEDIKYKEFEKIVHYFNQIRRITKDS